MMEIMLNLNKNVKKKEDYTIIFCIIAQQYFDGFSAVAWIFFVSYIPYDIMYIVF